MSTDAAPMFRNWGVNHPFCQPARFCLIRANSRLLRLPILAKSWYEMLGLLEIESSA
jgi:hypothetical protein